VPAALPLDPFAVFLALAASGAGCVRVLALLPGLVAGDLLAGLPWPVMLMRVFGALAVQGLLPAGGFHTRFVFVTCLQGLWSVVMLDWLNLYPAGFVYAAALAQGMLWWGLTAPLFGSGRLTHMATWLPYPLGLMLVVLVWDRPQGLWPLPEGGLGSRWPVAVWLTLMLAVHPLCRLLVQRRQAKRSVLEGMVWSREAKKTPLQG
jgi:hypothetical protein